MLKSGALLTYTAALPDKTVAGGIYPVMLGRESLLSLGEQTCLLSSKQAQTSTCFPLAVWRREREIQN